MSAKTILLILNINLIFKSELDNCFMLETDGKGQALFYESPLFTAFS